VVPHFIERGSGHVINVSSMLSRIPFATYRSAYNAAKAALNALTANLRVDLAAAHPGIQVSLVIPGLVTTDFGSHAIGGSPPLPPAALRDAQSPEEVADRITSLIEQPVAEMYTNPQYRDRVVAYYQDVAAFEQAAAARH
jgi:short-subunit dehydrogenase